MSNSGKSWFDLYGDDANWANGIAPIGAGSGISPGPSSKVGLFGGQYATMMENVARSRLAERLFGGPADLSGDGTGLPPSVTIAPYLPQLAASPPDGGPKAPTPFNLYERVRDLLNTPRGSKALQIAQDVAQSFEDNGNRAAGVGVGGIGLGLLTQNPPIVVGSVGLAALGGLFNELGKGVDAGTSFLKSIQQNNSRPSNQFVTRTVTPDFTDLEIPKGR